MTTCTRQPIPIRIEAPKTNGAWGRPSMTVPRPCSASWPAYTAICQASSEKKMSSMMPPKASSQAARRPVIHFARMSTFRLTLVAMPEGMVADTATQNVIAITSLSAGKGELNSQRNKTSKTVAPAAMSIPMTPRKASGCVQRAHHFSARPMLVASEAASAGLAMSVIGSGLP